MFPIIYQNHDLVIYSYPLFMGLGWGIAYQIFFSCFPSQLSRRYAAFLFWGIFLFAWVGSKLMFLVTSSSNNNELSIYQASFWLGGGFVFYGGLIGSLCFLMICKLFRLKLSSDVIWSLVSSLAIGHGIGRIGCALAGCCYGEVTNWSWGIFLHGHYRHPTQLIEASVLLVLGWYLLKSSRDKMILISDYLLGYGLLRFGLEFLRADLIRGIWGSLTPSQWISILLVVAGLVLRLNYLKVIDFKRFQSK
jgi:phosphatidylglycerol:prolipoprotein diacylglycerol transferase